MSGNVKKFKGNKGYESLDRHMLQDEENLSLEAIGLLANLTSYPDTWTLHKTELYKRFAKSGRRIVEKAWDNLIDNKYIIQLRKRNGQKYDYMYYHSQVPFTDSDIKEIEEIEGTTIWDGKHTNPSDNKVSSNVHPVQSKKEGVSNVHPVQSKLNSTECTDKKLSTKEVDYKDLDTIDTEDTKTDFLQTIHNSNNNSKDEEQKQKKKEEYMKKAFFENADKIPFKLADMLDTFTDTIKQAEKYYNSILIAKNKVENETKEMIWLEEEPELTQEVINAFSRSIRIIEKNKNTEEYIKKTDAYLYNAVYRVFSDEISTRQRNEQRSDSDLYYNWLEESN